jgi:hypothetical protein
MTRREPSPARRKVADDPHVRAGTAARPWNQILTGAVVLALAGFSAAARDGYVAART